MDETTRLAGLLQERLNDTIAEHRVALGPLGADADALFDEAQGFLSGGKRFRAMFALYGYQAVSPLRLDGPITTEFSAALNLGCALELFHAAALIHDDIIDRSETRRGRPATHRQFAAHHKAAGWRGSSTHFGVSAAILIGDLLQSWSDELADEAMAAIEHAARIRAVRQHFNRMRSEVAVGQYLDVLEEQRPAFAPHDEQLERSTRILVYKSAKYSVEAPLLLGGALAGATEEEERTLADFGLPVGVAFQLRDDLLGVFGDESVTGKPAGDDLLEGKRTVLVTLARNALPATQQRIFDDLLGTDLSPEQIGMLQHTIRESGAVNEIEAMISRNLERALATLDRGQLAPDATARLRQLADRAARRDA